MPALMALHSAAGAGEYIYTYGDARAVARAQPARLQLCPRLALWLSLASLGAVEVGAGAGAL